jgi:hypothetical protein
MYGQLKIMNFIKKLIIFWICMNMLWIFEVQIHGVSQTVFDIHVCRLYILNYLYLHNFKIGLGYSVGNGCLYLSERRGHDASSMRAFDLSEEYEGFLINIFKYPLNSRDPKLDSDWGNFEITFDLFWVSFCGLKDGFAEIYIYKRLYTNMKESRLVKGV